MLLIETVGWTATGVALVGVWFNNRRLRVCFALWLISNAMTFTIHAASDLWSLAARDVAFFVLAIHGWWLWRSPSGSKVADEASQVSGGGA